MCSLNEPSATDDTMYESVKFEGTELCNDFYYLVISTEMIVMILLSFATN